MRWDTPILLQALSLHTGEISVRRNSRSSEICYRFSFGILVDAEITKTRGDVPPLLAPGDTTLSLLAFAKLGYELSSEGWIEH